MTIGAITGMSGIGPIQSERISVPAAGSAPSAPSAQPIATGTQQPLSSAVLATLMGEQLALYGSFSSN
jgi:hypothetical protein